jgi:hypothetical protein
MESISAKSSRIDAIVKEMQERAQIFGLNDVEAVRWRELASFQHLIIPEDASSDQFYDNVHRNSSSDYSIPHQHHRHYCTPDKRPYFPAEQQERLSDYY